MSELTVGLEFPTRGSRLRAGALAFANTRGRGGLPRFPAKPLIVLK